MLGRSGSEQKVSTVDVEGSLVPELDKNEDNMLSTSEFIALTVQGRLAFNSHCYKERSDGEWSVQMESIKFRVCPRLWVAVLLRKCLAGFTTYRATFKKMVQKH